MNTPEGKVKDKLKAFLLRLRAYWHMPVQNGMGSPALDFHVCIPVVVTPAMVGKTVGIYVSIETKAEGKKPTPRQLATAERIEKSGGKVFIVDNFDHKEIATWLLALLTAPAMRSPTASQTPTQPIDSPE